MQWRCDTDLAFFGFGIAIFGLIAASPAACTSIVAYLGAFGMALTITALLAWRAVGRLD